MELGPKRRALLIGSLLAVTLHAFDELAVATALPLIAADLGGRELYGAVFYSYLLASIVGLVTAGWQAARFGPARPFAFGLVLFVAGLALAVVSPSMEVLVAARGLQGLGGGTLSTVVLVVVNRGFAAAERPQVMAWTSSAWVLPALVAPAIAGVVAERFGWRWVFAGLIPLAVAAGALGWPSMRALGAGHVERGAWAQGLDGLRLAAGIGLVLLALGRDPTWGTGLLLLGGIALASAPLLRILPDGFWRPRTRLATGVAVKLLLVFAFFGAEAFLPLALVEVRGTSASFAGLALSTAAICWTAGAFLHSRLAARVHPRALAALGVALVLVGICGLVSMLSDVVPAVAGFGAWGISGAGMGLAYNTTNVGAMAETRDGEEGSTSTALGVADALGISLATGLGGALVSYGDRVGQGTVDSLLSIWVAMAAVALAALAMSARLRPQPRETVPVRPSEAASLYALPD